MPNQHKPLPPEDIIRPHIERYYHYGLNDKAIESHMKQHYDTDLYGLSVMSIKRLRQRWDLPSTRQQRHTEESIAWAVAEIRKQYPSRGAQTICRQLRIQFGIRVSRIVSDYLNHTEPDAVQARRRRRFKRRRYYAAGISDVWGMDQHDKWGPRFGLWLHNGIDPFLSYNLWLKVWWTNKNPRLIASYYLEAVRKDGGIPLTTQSDPGGENYTVANMQTAMRHELDPTLADTLQHDWKRDKQNVKNEGNWSVFRRDFSPGMEDLFESGVNQGWYDVSNPIENLVFRWLAIPWVQSELDKWVIQRNETAPRANTKKVLPHGIPRLMRDEPTQYGLLDFKVGVTDELVDRMEQEYVPADHPVFQLTPPAFHEHAVKFYDAMGSPAVTFDSFWSIYKQLLQRFHTATAECLAGSQDSLQEELANHFGSIEIVEADRVSLVPGMRELRAGAVKIGTLNGVVNETDLQYADFTSSSSDSEEEEDVISDSE